MSLESAERPPTPIDPLGSERTVLIIGAGPAGLAAARAMTARGLRYDHVEKHSGIGGLWDIERTDGRLYNSAHFNSSRTLSAYNDFPFDDELPDYPRHDQILDSLKAFADRHSLVDRIRFGVTVESIDKTSDGSWTATFDDLSAATYSAVVCSSGTQWTANMPEIPGDFTGEVRHEIPPSFAASGYWSSGREHRVAILRPTPPVTQTEQPSVCAADTGSFRDTS